MIARSSQAAFGRPLSRLISAVALLPLTRLAATLIANCPERAPQCPDAKGHVTTAGAVCASACGLILAGGAERLVGPKPEVGVHQMTTVLREIEGSALSRPSHSHNLKGRPRAF